MIQTCTEVVGRVYDHEGEVDALMDEVERDILHISESRVQTQTITIKELVKKLNAMAGGKRLVPAGEE